MKATQCPVTAEELRRLYVEEKLTDEAIVERLGQEATVKRVRSWRHRYGIETIGRTERNDVLPIEGRLRSLLVGSMLGDGRLSRTVNASRYMENHADAQKDYLAWKIEQWGTWVKEPMAPVTWHKPTGDFHGWRFHTVSHPRLNEWHSLFYDAEGPKRLDSRVLDYVDAFALSVWFMDDGSTGWWPRITFGLGAPSYAIAMDIFAKFSLKPRWDVHKGNTGEFIFEGEDQAHLFIALVTPHMPECMASKLTFGFQGPHYQIRQVLTEDVLRDMASRGVPIKRMAEELGQSSSTIDRHLRDLGIHHPRKVGRPKQVQVLSMPPHG
jgi:hypothetical protein